MLWLIWGLLLALVIVGVAVAWFRPVAAGRMPAETVPGTLAWRVQGLRRANDLSLAALSDRTGLTTAYLSQLETGRKTNPSLETLETIAGVYDITVPELLVWTPNTHSLRAQVATLRADVAGYRHRGTVDLAEHMDALAGLLDILERLLFEGRDR